MPVPKSKRSVSKREYDAVYFRVSDDIVDMATFKFHASNEQYEKYKQYIATAKRLVKDGKVTDYEVLNWYRSWRGGLLKDYNACWNTVQSMDKLFNDLFPEIKKPERRSRNKDIREIFKEADYEDLQYFWRGIDNDSGLFEGEIITG